MLDYCSGADLLDPDDISWMIRWTGTPPETADIEGSGFQPCVYALKRNLYPNIPQQSILAANPIGTGTCQPITQFGPLSASGTIWAQELMNDVFNKYAENGFRIGAIPGTDDYNPFQEFLYELCCAYPIVCKDGLNSTCSMYSTQRLIDNPGAAGFCGCYLPPDEYASYVDTYQINKECTPMCNRPNVILEVDGSGNPLTCTQDVCMIDDNTIGLANTTVTGGISINQICGNCGDDATCTCIVADNTIEGANADIGGGININNVCGSTQCNVTNPYGGDPPTLVVPCDEMDDPTTAFDEQYQEYLRQQIAIKRAQQITVLVILFLAILVIIVAYFFIRPNWYTPEEQDVIITGNVKKKQGVQLPAKSKSESKISPSSNIMKREEIGSEELTDYNQLQYMSNIGRSELSDY
jgi:hypothetical protein